MGEILPGVTADNLHAPAEHPFNHQSACSRIYLLDAPGGTGKTFTIRTIQAIIKAREHSVIVVATFAVAASLLEDGQLRMQCSKYQFQFTLIAYAIFLCIPRSPKNSYKFR